MTIEKAIEILTSRDTLSKDYLPEVVSEATKLGIEALKAVDSQRCHGYVVIPRILPGETKE